MTDSVSQPMNELQPTTPPSAQEEALKDKIITRLCSVYDPEIPVNLYDLGLIYRIALLVAADGRYAAEIDMTLTAPACPMAEEMPQMVRDVLRDLQELASTTVNLVWDPPWDPSRMSEEARLQLNMI